MATSETPTAATETAVASTSWHHELPYVNRPKVRAYGSGVYGVAKYDDRDDTRFAWTRAVPAITALLLAIFIPKANAANAYCEAADSRTSVYGFCLPSVDAEGSNRWGDKINTNFSQIETTINGIDTSTSSLFIASLSASTASLNSLKYDKTGGPISGAVFSVGVSTLVTSSGKVGIGIATPLYKLHLFDGDFRMTQGQLIRWNSDAEVARAAIYGDSGDNLIFNTGAGLAERARFTTLGRFGIGTPNPVTALEVYAGTITASQFVGGGAGLTGVVATANSSGTTNVMNTGQTWVNTTFDGIAISGSSLAITTQGGSVVYHYNGSCRNDTAGTTTGLAVYQDGALISPQTSTRGATSVTNGTGASVFNCSFAFYIRTPSATLHSYYMAGMVSGGTGSLTTGSIGQSWLEELR